MSVEPTFVGQRGTIVEEWAMTDVYSVDQKVKDYNMIESSHIHTII